MTPDKIFMEVFDKRTRIEYDGTVKDILYPEEKFMEV